MRFAVFVHGEKVPAFDIEAERWPDALRLLADELESRNRDRHRRRISLDSLRGGHSDLYELTVHWLSRQ